ncbi:hypothetical protein AAG906_014769 [Vitis piasezkii]
MDYGRKDFTMENRIEKLTGSPSCPNLSTLLLDLNSDLHMISDGFSNLCPLSYHQKFLIWFHCNILIYLIEIKKLPIEMKNLIKLKVLNLRSTSKLSSIPRGLISSLLMLQVVGMYKCGLYGLVVEHALNHMVMNPCSKKLLSCTRAIFFKMFKGSSSLNISSLENMKHLFGVGMEDFDTLREIKFDWAGKGKETGEYSNLNPKVECFHGLHEVYINRCQMLKNLTWVIFVPNLVYLKIGECDEMEEVIGKGAEDGGNLSPFTKLIRLELNGLPQLKNSKKLPLNSNSANQGRVVIVGKQEWWNELEWEDEATLNTFLPSFQAI